MWDAADQVSYPQITQITQTQEQNLISFAPVESA
jgi:hypothetical protein